MSRVRKLSEGSSEISLHRLKQKVSSSRFAPVSNMKNAKLSISPYSKLNKITKTPSYMKIQPSRISLLKKSNSNSSVRTRRKESKSIGVEEISSFNLAISPWETLKSKAKDIKGKLQHIEKYSNNFGNYMDLFEELIGKDLVFSSSLKKIKAFYDKEILNLQEQISEGQRALDVEIMEKQGFVRMLERISKENIDLGGEIQRLEEICVGLQENIEEIQNFKLKDRPRNESDWKALMYENSRYSEICQNMKLDIQDYQYKEDQLIKLVDALKERGFPVDEVYEEDIRGKEETSSESAPSLSTSNFKKIPLLELAKISSNS